MKSLQSAAPIGGRVQGYLSQYSQIPTLKEFRPWLRQESRAWARERLAQNAKGWKPDTQSLESFKKDLVSKINLFPKVIGLFFSNPQWDEVSLEFFAELESFLNFEKIQCAFPRLNSNEKLEFAVCTLNQCVPQGSFGIQSAPAEAPLCKPQIFLVPASLVDLSGQRLGRGRGHYDTYFSNFFSNALDTQKRDFWCCAVIHSDAVIKGLPDSWVQPHDVRVNSILANNFYLRSQNLC